MNKSSKKCERLIIDPTEAKQEYGWARLMNCSRRHANLRPRGVKLKAYPFVEIRFEAKQNIRVGEELLFDYDPQNANKGFPCP